jgi:N-acetyl-alpha-D-glucosaminyl L-malate synthase BshA
MFESAPYTLAIASSLIELARAERIDVIHSHYAVPHAASVLLAKQALAAAAPATVTTLHGTDVTSTGLDPSYAPVTRHAVRASDAISVVSSFLAERAREWLCADGQALAPDAIEIASNFVDTDAFTPPAARDRGCFDQLFDAAQRDEPVLFHVSNFRAVKRVGDLIDVLARVRRTLPARLVVVGEGPERARAEEKARALGLENNVRFLGKQVGFVELLRHADAFMLPSESESFGLAALEAMSCGVPVLGYRVGGLPEVVSEASGVLVEPFEIDALAHATRELLADTALRDRLSQGARARVLACFRREPALARYEALYEHALSRAAEGRG